MLAKGNAEDVEGGSISTAGEEHADGPHELRLRRMSSESLGEDKTLPDGKAHSADEGGSAGEGEGQHSRSSASPVMTKPPAEPDTLVDDVFRGKLRSTVVCLTCKAISASHEPFLDLSLHLPRGTAEEEAQAEAEAEAAEPVVMAGKTKSQKKAARRQQQIMQQLKEAEGEGDGEGDREGEGEEMGEGERGHEPGASDAGESVDGSGCGGSSVSDDGERGSEEEVASEEALAASEGWLIVDAEQLAEDESVRDRRRFGALRFSMQCSFPHIHTAFTCARHNSASHVAHAPRLLEMTLPPPPMCPGPMTPTTCAPNTLAGSARGARWRAGCGGSGATSGSRRARNRC